jgi:hypothetical protein
MRFWHHTGLTIVAVVGLSAPWFFDFGRTDALICWVGTMLFLLVGQLEMRMKTIQIRLAGMEDKLDLIKGKEPEDNLILELNDW